MRNCRPCVTIKIIKLVSQMWYAKSRCIFTISNPNMLSEDYSFAVQGGPREIASVFVLCGGTRFITLCCSEHAAQRRTIVLADAKAGSPTHRTVPHRLPEMALDTALRTMTSRTHDEAITFFNTPVAMSGTRCKASIASNNYRNSQSAGRGQRC